VTDLVFSQVDVLFLSLALRCNLAITNSQFNARPIVYLSYRKTLHDNTYKQWELGWVMVIGLIIDFGELEKLALKRDVWLGKSYGPAGFCGPCVCLGVSVPVDKGACVRDCGWWGCVQLV
jgi:hypothetical protein